jgi:hypothetical protein
LPDYIELLDELHLPKIRKSNYLIGIWVLNKGKLAPPNDGAAGSSVAVLTSNPNPPALNIPLSAPPVPSAPNAPSTVPLQIEPAALAAEVASLTPEQIQIMLRTLTTPTPLPLPAAPSGALSTAPPLQNLGSPAHPIPPTQPPPPIHAPPVPIPPQPWTTATPGFSAGFPPPNPRGQSSPPYPHSPYERRDYGRESWSGAGHDRDRGDQSGPGWRGRGHGRGRGRGRDDGGESPHKPIDSGWPRKPHSRGGGPSSPKQGRWGESWR